MSRRRSDLGKSLGTVIPPPFRAFSIPGTGPDRRTIQALKVLTAMPSRKMNLRESPHPCFTPQRVVEGLGMNRGQESDWARYIAKAMTAPNELIMRQDIMSKMFEEKMDARLRRALFSRSLSLWREKGRMSKSVFVVTVEAMNKADPRGGKYYKRTPKTGGGFTYFYDEDKYNSHKDAHVSGGDAAHAAITKAVAGHVKEAGKNGCELAILKPLAKRYGADMVGGMLNQACASGELVYQGKRLYQKGTAPKKAKAGKPKQNRNRTDTERKPKPGREKSKTEVKKSLPKSVMRDVSEPLVKAAPHKYVRRVPKPGGGYRYFYRESAAAREATAGEEVRLGKRMARVVSVAQGGAITLEIEGKRRTITPKQWHDLLTKHYGRAFIEGARKRAQQTINAVMRHVPRALLADLKGATDEERLEDLRKRVPEVYGRLQKAFSRAGMSPFAAKRSLSMVLERRGWSPEARALVIGTVLRHRKIGTRNLIDASENLAGGRPVHEGHVAAVVELRAPGGRPEAFPAKTAELAKSAEAELASLIRTLSSKGDDANQKAAEVLAEVMSSEAMQKLQMLAKAYPGLVDKAIEPTRKVILGAGSIVPRTAPTTEGGETVVYVAGEGGNPKALEARYRLVEADTLIASHDPETFARRQDYPEDVQERAYHRDKVEQAKVIRNAQKMDPRFVVNTNPDAVNGPPMVTADGVVLGGNSRAMSMQRIYKMHPEKATEMRKYLESHSHEVGLKPEDVQAMKNPVLIREIEVEDKSKAGLQVLVRQMNETFIQGMDPRTMQVAMGRKLTERTLQALADSMGEDETLASFLESSRSERFVSALFQAGIIDNRNVNQYMRKGTRTLNNDGRMLVSRILVGRTVDNADVLSDTGVQMMDAIAGAVPSMVKATASGGSFDVGPDLGVAVDAFNDLQRLVSNGVIPALDSKMSASVLNRLYSYFDVLPGIGESHPVVRNERSQILLEILIRKRGPVQMAKVFREYAKIAAANQEGQGAMFGTKVSPIDALKQASGVGDKEPQLRLVASMSAREERFVIGAVL